jgi:hypothetical protein
MLTPKKREVLLLAPFFILVVIFFFKILFPKRYRLLRSQFQTSCNFNPEKKASMLGAPLFNSGINFNVFVCNFIDYGCKIL